MPDFDKILKNISPSEVERTLFELQSMSLSTADFNVVKEKVRLLVQCGFMIVTFPLGKFIYRGRLWDINKQAAYKTKSQVSYPPADESGQLKLNRASTNKFQIFYGAVATQDLNQGEVVAMTEVSNVFDGGLNEDEDEYTAIGEWFVKEEFSIATLALHSEIAKQNQDAQKMLKFHSEACDALKDRGDLVNKVAMFLSKEFEKKVEKGEEHEYMISAAYGDLLLEFGIPGVMFPSVKGDGKAFNVALHKNIVDHCLDLNVAAVSRAQLIGEEVFVGWHLQCTDIDREGRMKWEIPPGRSFIGAYERKEILKNMFRNNGKFINPKDMTERDAG